MLRSAEEQRKFENRARVLKTAHDDLQSSPPETDAPSEIDDDWLNFFVRLAEDKSSEELQQLFGKILSGEVRRPGSFSLRTLQIMATISKPEAERVSRVLSYALDAMIVPFQEGPEHSDRLLIEEVGLAGTPSQFSGVQITWTIPGGQRKIMGASTLAIVISNNGQKEISLTVSGQILTTAGRELVAIANPLRRASTFSRRWRGRYTRSSASKTLWRWNAVRSPSR
jgi:hypothetical protein